MEKISKGNFIMCYYDNDWQKPVITEQNAFNLFYAQNSLPFNYFAFPWANYIDNKWKNNTKLNQIIDSYINTECSSDDTEYFTVAQHIYFMELIDIFVKLNIKYIFTPHREQLHDNIEKKYNLKIIPYLLFPAQHNITKQIVPMSNRKYLTSFVGQYDPNCYISDIRIKIFEQMVNCSDCHVLPRNSWHYNKMVYGGGTTDKNNEIEYKMLLSESKFSICPSGSGPNSIRIWEAMSFGSVPVILADTLQFPNIKGIDWNDYFIFWPENNFHNLYAFMRKFDLNKLNKMSNNCINLYYEYCAPNAMHKVIIDYFQNN
jgi:hypothetical protein